MEATIEEREEHLSVVEGKTEEKTSDRSEAKSEGYVSVTYEQMLSIRNELLEQYDRIQSEKEEQQRIYDALQEEKAEQKRVYDKFIAEKTAFNEDMKSLNAKVLQERKKLKEETAFFEKKMQILQNGFMQLDIDRKKLERERAEFESTKADRAANTQRTGQRVSGTFNASQFFIGVNGTLTLRKRYKDLLKIFHPDNLCGDEAIVKAINEEYERLRREF
ncbi:MAG: hypothetical protein K6E68_02380 [Lachnospiraceae bacterium]|nr:hypothetical protein [Lachnospiraceae bacterium]